jgi:hypothetical protein
MDGFWRSQRGVWWPLRVAGWRHDRAAALLDYLPQRLVWDAGLVLLFGSAAAEAIVQRDASVMLAGASLVFLLTVWRGLAAQSGDAIPEGLTWCIYFAEVIVWGAVADVFIRAIWPNEHGLADRLLVVVTWAIYSYLLADLIGPPRERKRVRVPRLSLRLSPAPSPA